MADIFDQPQPRGGKFVEFALEQTLKHVQNGRKDPRVVEWTRQQVAAGGAPKSMLGRAELLFRAFCERVSYVEDPYECEFIAKPRDVMCLPDADFCMRASDCEESAAALCAVFGAAGLQTCLVHQRFTRTNHAISAVLVENGWKRADPSYYKEHGETLGRHYIAGWERWIDTMTGTTLHTGNGKTVPGGPVSDSVLLGKRPMHDFVSINGLGAADAGDVVSAWAGPLALYRQQMVDSFARANATIVSLQSLRDQLGIPQYDAADSPGWTADVASIFYGALSTAVRDLDRYATEALARKREVAWADDGSGNGTLVIGAKAGDKTSYGVGPNDAITTTTLPATPGGGGLGNALLVGAVLAGAVVQSVTVYLVVSKLCETYQMHAAAERQKDLSKVTDLVQSGKATPEQAVALVRALGESAKAAPKPPQNDLVSLLKTLVIGVAVVGTLGVGYIAAEKLLAARKAA